jgi:hypothetical protein
MGKRSAFVPTGANRGDVYYDYLEQEILARDEQWRRRVLLVRATIAYLIRHSQGSILVITRLIYRRIQFKICASTESRKCHLYVSSTSSFSAYGSFFPINDNDDPTTGHGGSHWSSPSTA